MITMLKASSHRGVIVETEIKKIDGDTVHPMKGGADRMNNGYSKYFKEDEREEAVAWIIMKRARSGLPIIKKGDIK